MSGCKTGFRLTFGVVPPSPKGLSPKELKDNDLSRQGLSRLRTPRGPRPSSETLILWGPQERGAVGRSRAYVP